MPLLCTGDHTISTFRLHWSNKVLHIYADMHTPPLIVKAVILYAKIKPRDPIPNREQYLPRSKKTVVETLQLDPRHEPSQIKSKKELGPFFAGTLRTHV